MNSMRYVIATACMALLAVTTAGAQSTVTVEGLLHEMVDMERLSTIPDADFECDQHSSYDRRSTAPDQPEDLGAGWFANGDAGKFIREEETNGRKEWVMAEMDGPGAIVRLWSANPDGGGNIRIYIDDLSAPALEADFLALTSGDLPGFPAPFAGRRAMGANLYLPLPYQERCKVTVDKPGLYYEVGYRTYPAQTTVEPFSMDVLTDVASTMADVGRILARPAQRFTTDDATRSVTAETIKPGGSLTIDLDGPAAIVRMEANVQAAEDHLFVALREPVLMMKFDGKPCVWTPLGDFFSSTPGVNTYESLPCGMKSNGTCYSNWYMPYAKKAAITVRNDSDDPVTLRLVIWTKPAKLKRGKFLYFRAGWRNEWLPRDPAFVDWCMLEAEGPGRFAGVMLGVVNTAGQWWGEGDEKVWVDGDTFPSYFGTGSEDYFGYAWCSPELFTHAYHNQSIVTGPANFGYTAVSRYHILDDIPFDESIKFDIEKWGAADREYCCTTYWYSAGGARDFFEPVPVDDRRVRPLPEPFKVKGALEGEELEIARLTGGETQIQTMPGEFSGQKHLWWTNPEEGDIIEVKVPVAKAGRYDVILGITKSWDYGIHQVVLNGEDVGDPVDFHTTPPFKPAKIDLGIQDLSEANRLGLRCVGTNPAAEPVRYMAAIDYILLKPVK